MTGLVADGACSTVEEFLHVDIMTARAASMRGLMKGKPWQYLHCVLLQFKSVFCVMCRYHMMGGKNPRGKSRSAKQQEAAGLHPQNQSSSGAVGFDPARGGDLPWQQPGFSPRDNRNGGSGSSHTSGQSQVMPGVLLCWN